MHAHARPKDDGVMWEKESDLHFTANKRRLQTNVRAVIMEWFGPTLFLSLSFTRIDPMHSVHSLIPFY